MKPNTMQSMVPPHSRKHLLVPLLLCSLISEDDLVYRLTSGEVWPHSEHPLYSEWAHRVTLWTQSMANHKRFLADVPLREF